MVHRRQICDFVLRLDVPTELDAPDLLAARSIAQRAEGDLRFERPAPLEPPGLELPNRVPIEVKVALVRDLAVHPSPERVEVEQDPVPAVVEGVQHEGERLVGDQVEVVAPHFVSDPLRLGTRAPAARGDVEMRGIEEQPDLRLLGGGRPVVWIELD